MKRYDMIVIGAGHNGLTAATILARSGKQVLLLEKRKLVGGIAAGEEFYPGYSTNGLLHDTSGVRLEVVKKLNLESFGLEIQDQPADICLLSNDNKNIVLNANPKISSESIGKISQKDAQAFVEYREFLAKISKVINDLMDNPPPKINVEDLNLSAIIALLKKGLKLKGLGNKAMLELLKVAPMSVADFLNELFETELLKAGLAAPALYGSYAGPFSAYSTINLLLWECAHRVNIKGGPQALVSALHKAALEAGVEIRTDTEVERILLDNNDQVKGVRLTGGEEVTSQVVASSCTPKQTFLELFDDFDLEYELIYWIEKLRGRGTIAKVNIALSKKLEFDGQRFENVRIANSFIEMEKAFDPVKYGEVTTNPFLDIHIPSVSSPSLAPEGHDVLSILVHQVPYHYKDGWNDKSRQELRDTVFRVLKSNIPGIADSIVGYEVLTPLDLEQRYSLTEGHIYHGEHFVDQLLTRPIPSCMNYHTPVNGLFLCGSGSHPGGGITCAPGSMAAKEILRVT